MSLKFLVLTSFLFGLTLGAPADSNNQEGCHKKIKKYRLSIDKANFYQAFINCKNEGMELASAESEEESQALDEYLDPHKVEKYVNGFWLSGTNINNLNSTQYYWLSTGNRAIFTNWILGEPNNYGGVEHHMIWALANGKTGWVDQNPTVVSGYVCQYYIET